MAIRLKLDVPLTALSISVFSYVLSLFLIATVEGLSRLVHVAIGLNLLSLIFMSWSRPLKIRLDPILLLVWSFFIFAYLSTYWAVNRSGAVVSVASLFFDILGATLVWLALCNGLSLRIIGYSAMIGGGIQALTAINQFLAGEGEMVRVEGLTGNANALAIQLSLAAFLVLITFRRSFWSALLALVFVLVATVVSGSRKIVFVWFAFSLLLLQYLVVRFRNLASFRILLVIGLPLLSYMVVAYSGDLLKPVQSLYVYERFQSTVEGKESSANVRQAMLQEGLSLWQEAPLKGYGINQFRYVSSYSTYSHSNYSELLVSFGVIGFSLYYITLLILACRAVRGLFRKSPYALLVGVATLLLLLLDLAMVSYTGRMIWLFMAVLIFLSQHQSKPVELTHVNEPGRLSFAKRVG